MARRDVVDSAMGRTWILVAGAFVFLAAAAMVETAAGSTQLSGGVRAGSSYTCTGSQVKLFDNTNGFAIGSGGTTPTFSTGGKAYCVTYIQTYHWNDGKGSPPGRLGLRRVAGSAGLPALIGPLAAKASAGQNNAPKVNWHVGVPTAAPQVIDGSYSCTDSDPATWSANSQSGGAGFCIVQGVPAVLAGSGGSGGGGPTGVVSPCPSANTIRLAADTTPSIDDPAAFAKDIDGLTASLKAHAKLYISKTKQDHADAQIDKANKLIEQLSVIAQMEATPDTKLTPAQRAVVAENAAVALAGTLAGKTLKGEEVAEAVTSALKAVNADGAKASQTRFEIFDKYMQKAIKQALLKSGVKEEAIQSQYTALVGQIDILGRLALGNPTDAERDEMFQKAVIGLLERTVFNGFLDAPLLKAATTGYDLGKPFGDFIQKNLQAVLNAKLLAATKTALDAADPTWRADLDGETRKTITGTIDLPAEFHGWTVTAFRQGCSDYVQITGTAVSTVRAFFGAHQDVYVVTADDVERQQF
ncbi:MAG TPA: hypothetical protein VG652_10700 [Gaiellaceae bacterium]|nr:hypothetical protein [Gaiellaceae bacterium]